MTHLHEDYRTWFASAETLSLERYGLGVLELTGHRDGFLWRAYQAGDTPPEVVEYWAERFDLDRIDKALSIQAMCEQS